MQISITENAFHKLHSFAETNKVAQGNGGVELKPSISPAPDTKRLRIKVKGGGCSGYKYEYSTDNTYGDNDIVFDYDGVGVVIDKISAELIDGVTVDYVVELGGEYFQIKNPKVINQCSCGNSFSL